LTTKASKISLEECKNELKKRIETNTEKLMHIVDQNQLQRNIYREEFETFNHVVNDNIYKAVKTVIQNTAKPIETNAEAIAKLFTQKADKDDLSKIALEKASKDQFENIADSMQMLNK
jgi:poly-beta-hydroxyalkanoate depolymerase